MVAVVTGNSLGLDRTSLGILGDRGVWGSASQGSGAEQVYVNAATGNLVIRRVDDGLVSDGLDIQAIRTYNSQGTLNDDNGDNWYLGAYSSQLSLVGTFGSQGSTLTRSWRDGSSSVFTWDVSRSAYMCRDGAGAHDTIVFDTAANQYVLTEGSSRVIERYDASNGRLVSLEEEDQPTDPASKKQVTLS